MTKATTDKKTLEDNIPEQRPPVIAIMGHIDHGKSTLLDYIRKSNSVDKEAGGITQHLSAYEVDHTTKDGKTRKITFLDTPGHEAFCSIRKRGANVADMAILIVSAEDGVKPQTLEALSCIKDDNLPYIVAINKIDKPGANVEFTKQNLAENEIYLEGYGGDISYCPISAKLGDGVEDLLDTALLFSDILELKAVRHKQGEGIIIESSLDSKKGISATLIIKSGTIKTGSYLVSGSSISSVRIMEDYNGKQINEASFSSPVKIIGWDSMPLVGATFKTFQSKDSAMQAKDAPQTTTKNLESANNTPSSLVIPIIIKADASGSIDAIKFQIQKADYDKSKINIKIVNEGLGQITETDVKMVGGGNLGIILGFNTSVDKKAEILAEKYGTTIKIFNIIYNLSDWLKEIIVTRTPKSVVEETLGTSKILKTFSQSKDRQLVGARVLTGLISVGSNVKILRRENLLGYGRVIELQQQKMKASVVHEESEYGAMLDSKIEVSPGDILESFHKVEI